MASADARLAEFQDALAKGGLEAAVRVLNDGVPHRYTALYRLRGSMLLNHTLFDKRGEAKPEYLATVPWSSSFCQYVFRDGVFNTIDSPSDRRLDGHPYQGVVICYSGTPIVDHAASGAIIGSLSHFDLVRHEISDVEFELLQRAARLIDSTMIG